MTNTTTGGRSRGVALGKHVQAQIEDAILTGALKPGERLDERMLAERYAVSRTPVREALSALAAAGLVEGRGRNGVFVARLTASELFEMFDAMSELESLCAKLAARRMTEAERQALRRLGEAAVQVADSNDKDRYQASNFAFHDAIYRGAHNRFLEGTTRQFRRRMAPYRRYSLGLPNRLRQSAEEHMRIVQAICAGDADAAFTAMQDHLNIHRPDYSDFVLLLTQMTSEPAGEGGRPAIALTGTTGA